MLGDPVAQVRTPELINPLFARHRIDIVSFPLHVPAAGFDAAWNLLIAAGNVAAIATTVPHKISAALRCDRLTEDAEAIGAVNAARREADGTMLGAMFDGIGFVNGLGEMRHRLAGARIVQVGAGGAGRAIVHALCMNGVASIDIVDIDRQAAQSAVDLANRIAGRQLARVSSGCEGAFDMLVNASPVGVKSDDESPLPPGGLAPGMHVADIASFGKGTRLLEIARDAACTISDGMDMLTAQLDLVAGFVAGLPPGVPLGSARRNARHPAGIMPP